MALIGSHNLCLLGGDVTIRDAELSDAAAMLACTRANIVESNVLLMELSEFNFTIEQEEEWISNLRAADNTFIMVAEQNGEIIGLLDFRATAFRRERHRGSFGIALRSEFRGLGIGSHMIQIMLNWAERHPELEKIELSALSINERAIELYKRLGFIELAHSPKHYKLADGSYADNVIMYRFVKTTATEH